MAMAAELSRTVKQHVTFTVPRKTLLKLRKAIPGGLRSRFVSDAIEQQLSERGGLRARCRNGKARDDGNG